MPAERGAGPRPPGLFAAGIVVVAVLMAGCAASRPAVVPMSFPSKVDGIPVHRVAWNRPLPYVTKGLYLPWRTKAPGSYRVSPELAIERACRLWPALCQRAKVVYIQPTGLLGGRTGNPTSAYVVEVAAPNLGFNGAPAPLTPPKMEFELFIVNGKTGAAQMAVGGGYPPQQLVLSWVPLVYDAAYGPLYRLGPVAFTDGIREVASGDLSSDSATGILITFDLQKQADPIVIKVPDAGELRITGFKGDRLIYVQSATLGAGTFELGSDRIAWRGK